MNILWVLPCFQGMRSKILIHGIGACIVSEDNKDPVNGIQWISKGCSDDEFPWGREGDPLDTKYLLCDTQ